jgi:pyruvate/2-oxoglutarate dehydrogenase complex dihydrolipoamide acyltransferase (E2) component
MITEVLMPPLGETMDEGKILRWLKKEGEPVEKGEPLLEIETDKTTVQLESFGAGVLRKIFQPEDATVPIGELLAVIAEEDEDIDKYLSSQGDTG